jgi:hypothetical protein
MSEAVMSQQSLCSVALVISICCPALAPADELPPAVIDISLTAVSSAHIFTATITATNNPESWSLPVGPYYIPGLGAIASSVGLLIPPTWNAASQTLTWDSSGSTGGTYFWTVTASNSAGSDSGTITTNVFGKGWYGDLLPIVDHLEFAVQSPLSNGGVVAGTVTATDNAEIWSELLYPSYKTQALGPVSTPSGIQSPIWNPVNREFNWDMSGAHAGIYTWYVKAQSIHGYTGAGKIEVTILVPEPSTVLLTLLAILGVASMIRQRLR